MPKRLYIAYTGGTIGMSRTPDGYAPAPGFLAAQMAAMPELADPRMPGYDDPRVRSAARFLQHAAGGLGAHRAGHRGALRRLRRLPGPARHRHDGLHRVGPAVFPPGVAETGDRHRLADSAVRDPQRRARQPDHLDADRGGIPAAGSVPLLRREAAARLPGGEGGRRRPGSLRLAQVPAAGRRRGGDPD